MAPHAAHTESTPPLQSEETGLKYLGVVEIAVDKVKKYLAGIYSFTKESSGPLKPSVHRVESSVRTVIGPFYKYIEGKPYGILLYVDQKVDNAVGVIEGAIPPSVKKRSYEAYGIAKQVPETVKSVVFDLQTNGVIVTAQSYYATYEPFAEKLAYSAWKQFLKLPFAPLAVHFASPPTLFCAKKFNQVVSSLRINHFPLAAYIPTVPVEKFARAVKVHGAA